MVVDTILSIIFRRLTTGWWTSNININMLEDFESAVEKYPMLPSPTMG
jgi:hypothetical protein